MLRLVVGTLTLLAGVWIVASYWGPLMRSDDRFYLIMAVIFGWIVRSMPWLTDEDLWKVAECKRPSVTIPAASLRAGEQITIRAVGQIK